MMRLVLLFTLMMMSIADASPASDLASPSQQTRDAAAKTLRESYSPPPRARWERLLASIKVGTTEQKVLARLKLYKVKPEMGAAGGGGESTSYRLDDRWLLRCAFRTSDRTLFAVELVEQTRNVWIEPPPDFTGVWTVYFANGQRSHEIHYKDGKYHGAFTSFHDDGSKSVVQTYGPRGADGEDIGYYRSGRIAYRGMYKHGKRVGTWTHYDETGKVTSTEKLP